MIRVQNTRATIEDFYKGKIGEIIFEEYGENKDFVIFNKTKLAYDIGRKICDRNDKITTKEIIEEVNDEFDNIVGLIAEYVIEYVQNNFEGEYEE